MILDFALVIVLLVCLSLLTSRKKEFLLSLEQNSLATGILLSAIKMLMLAGLLEKADTTKIGLADFLIKLMFMINSAVKKNYVSTLRCRIYFCNKRN